MPKIISALFIFILVLFSYLTEAQITGIKIIGDTCSSLTLDLQAVGTSSSPYFFWNFGDPLSGTNDTTTITGTSSTPFPTHTFTSAGIYTVCVSFQEPGYPVSTVCRTISIGLCCNGIIASNDICLQNAISFSILTSDTINNVSWNFGDPISGVDNTAITSAAAHIFSGAGIFVVRAIVDFSCGRDTLETSISIIVCDTSLQNDCKLYVSNVFTPNGDNVNDYFYSIQTPNCDVERYEVLVFDRWGGLLFKTSSYDEKWDGKYKGSDCASGVYVYRLEYKFPTEPQKVIYGTITLLR